MAFIRYKTINDKRYAYEITSYWDKELKKPRTKSKYIGIVDDCTNEVTKFIKKPKLIEKLILDFGDGYFVNEVIKNSILFAPLQDILTMIPELIPLIVYKIITQSAMKNCQTWCDTNILNVIYKNPNLSSQRISNILNILGKEEIQRSFFKEYNQSIKGIKKSIIIDATCMPTTINHQFNAWGKSDGGIQEQFKLLCVVDQNSKLPLFYRFISGNITDITTLTTTILELEAMGIKNNSVLLDAGFFSEQNIKDLYAHRINFITRIPNSRKVFKNALNENISQLEHIDNVYLYGERTIFIKKIKIDLYKKNAYLYLILDPVKKMKDMQDTMIEFANISRKTKNEKQQYAQLLLSAGVIGLVSSKSIPEKEILSCYYLRQSVEQIFGFLKDDLNLLPIRQHNDSTIRGYLFLQFISLIIFITIREKLNNKYTVEKILMILRGIKCKVFEDQIITSELTKDQRLILENCKIMMPKKMRI